jgi:hypothetical protein
MPDTRLKKKRTPTAKTKIPVPEVASEAEKLQWIDPVPEDTRTFQQKLTDAFSSADPVIQQHIINLETTNGQLQEEVKMFSHAHEVILVKYTNLLARQQGNATQQRTQPRR